MKKLGIFGGTFDPIHNGHLILAEHIRQACGLDKIIFMPNYIQPFKQGKNTHDSHRADMVRQTISGREYFDITNIELESEEISYTYNSLTRLKEEYEGAEIFFITGADIFLSIKKWFRFTDLIKEFSFIVGMRPGTNRTEIQEFIEELEREYQANIKLIDNPQIDISSSKVREIILSNDYFSGRDKVRDMVPDRVCEYIYLTGVYANDNVKLGSGLAEVFEDKILELRDSNNPSVQKRIGHILSTRDFAVHLARIYEVDVIKTNLAALAHDYIKLIGTDEEKNSLEHGALASRYLMDNFGVNDADVLNAISYHTTSRAGASVLEKIIFLADKLEIERDYKGLREIRDMAFNCPINELMRETLEDVLEVLKKRGIEPSKDTLEAYDGVV